MKPVKDSPEASEFRIGDWVFEPEYNRLTGEAGEEQFIESRLARILAVLLAANGSVVRRQDLLDAVWGDVEVNEESLTKGIFDLRKFFKEGGMTRVEIETIRNVGYRLRVDETPRTSAGRRVSVLVLKGVLSIFLFLSFLSILVRAFRYEN